MDAGVLMARMNSKAAKGINIADSMTPEIEALAVRIKNLAPAMKQVESQVMGPLKQKAWSDSGIKSETGEIKKAVETFSGKRSAGVGFKAKGLGRTDAGFAVARGSLLARGAKKNQYRRRKQYIVKAHIRRGKHIREHTRVNHGAPWGDIKARPFIPTALSSGDEKKILDILMEYVQSK